MLMLPIKLMKFKLKFSVVRLKLNGKEKNVQYGIQELYNSD